MRGTKRSPSTLLAIAALTLVLQWLEAVWTIAPGFDSNGMAIVIVSLVIVVLFAAVAAFAARVQGTVPTRREARLDG